MPSASNAACPVLKRTSSTTGCYGLHCCEIASDEEIYGVFDSNPCRCPLTHASSLRKTLCQVVVCRSTDIDFEAWDIAPWTGWHGACRWLFRRAPGSRCPLCRFVSPQFLFRLNAVSLYDRRNQSWKALVDFRASRRFVHLDASPFATN